MKSRRRFGQHFLEPAWVERLLGVVAPAPSDDFVEIGPGRGALTLPLARAARSVVAVEVDRRLVAWLRPRLPSNVRLVEGDVLAVPWASLLPQREAPGRVRVVGNLPYYISTPILTRLIDAHRSAAPFVDACVMLQREVADRITASPGTKAYGVLSIAIQLDADVSTVLHLPPGAFRPAPEVSSAVVQIRFRTPAVTVNDRAVFDALVRGLFSQRRKTAANALRPFALRLGKDAAALLAEAGIDGRRRPETLDLPELARLANLVAAGGALPVV